MAENKGLLTLIKDNIARFDCQVDCPDEVAIYELDHYGETIRTPEYCNRCFTGQILTEIRKAVEGAGLTKETIQKHCKDNHQAPMMAKELINANYGAYIQLQAILRALTI